MIASMDLMTSALISVVREMPARPASDRSFDRFLASSVLGLNSFLSRDRIPLTRAPASGPGVLLGFRVSHGSSPLDGSRDS